MPREKIGYRENLERICEKYPNKEYLNITEVSIFLGVSKDFTKKTVKFGKDKYVSKASLASQLAVG